MSRPELPEGYRRISSYAFAEQELFVCDTCRCVVIAPVEEHTKVCAGRWPWPGAPSSAVVSNEALGEVHVDPQGEGSDSDEAGGNADTEVAPRDGQTVSADSDEPSPAEAPRITPESPAPTAEEGLAAAELVARIEELAPRAIPQGGARESWLRTLLHHHGVDALDEMARRDLLRTANELRASIERRRREARAS